MNQVIISGRLTKQPELRMTESRKKVVTGTIAVTRTKEITDFIDFVAWEVNAERLEKYADKGCRVIVNGELQTRFYEKGEIKHKITELSVRNIDIIDFKPQIIPTNNVKAEVNNVEIRVNGVEPSIIQYVSDEDLPF